MLDTNSGFDPEFVINSGAPERVTITQSLEAIGSLLAKSRRNSLAIKNVINLDAFTRQE